MDREKRIRKKIKKKQKEGFFTAAEAHNLIALRKRLRKKTTGLSGNDVQRLVRIRQLYEEGRFSEGTWEELETKSRNGGYVHRDPATHLRHILNHKFNPKYEKFTPIVADYGLQLTDDNGNEVAACSFNLICENADLVMSVVEMPHGYKTGIDRRSVQITNQPDPLTADARQGMIQGLKVVAEDLGCVKIVVISALEHGLSGRALRRGRERYDYPAMACGFRYDHATKNLVLPLK